MKNRVCENYGTKKHVPDSVPKIGNNVSILVGNKTTKKDRIHRHYNGVSGLMTLLQVFDYLRVTVLFASMTVV